MSRRLIVILAIGAAALVWGWLDGPAARQRRGMDAASAFAQQLSPKLAADPRFASVDTGVTTHPALRVYGEVADEQSLRDLNALVVAPPDANYRVMVNVAVVGPSATQPAHTLHWTGATTAFRFERWSSAPASECWSVMQRDAKDQLPPLEYSSPFRERRRVPPFWRGVEDIAEVRRYRARRAPANEWTAYWRMSTRRRGIVINWQRWGRSKPQNRTRRMV
jgi:hypothetical protein